ncbi:hypothetical protein [Azospirillum canadense]|uniref:hypothetical protein n=1 Tax=Azospirillum canadense TaxID=403962 RepID=UPI002227FEF4|nr:hypothetical protein [Azospirillum canadense]MCW2240350.1 hypothetical protein [Azospirillum canadense]
MPRDHGPDDDLDTDRHPDAGAHWHYTMVQPRLFGICHIYAVIPILGSGFYHLFEYWWPYKTVIIVATIAAFTVLEQRRITPDVALRQMMAWARGPSVPCLPRRCHRHLGPRGR